MVIASKFLKAPREGVAAKGRERFGRVTIDSMLLPSNDALEAARAADQAIKGAGKR